MLTPLHEREIPLLKTSGDGSGSSEYVDKFHHGAVGPPSLDQTLYLWLKWCFLCESEGSNWALQDSLSVFLSILSKHVHQIDSEQKIETMLTTNNKI